MSKLDPFHSTSLVVKFNRLFLSIPKHATRKARKRAAAAAAEAALFCRVLGWPQNWRWKNPLFIPLETPPRGNKEHATQLRSNFLASRRTSAQRMVGFKRYCTNCRLEVWKHEIWPLKNLWPCHNIFGTSNIISGVFGCRFSFLGDTRISWKLIVDTLLLFWMMTQQLNLLHASDNFQNLGFSRT